MTRSAAAVLILLLVTFPAAAENSFYRVLAAKPNATTEDAVRGFYELALGTAAGTVSFQEQARTLVDMKIIKPTWSQKAEERLTRGRAAYMICRTCGVKGGLTMRILGPSERYAFRECTYLDVWSSGTPRDYMTGGELMGVLKWTADYIEEHPGKRRPTLPPPTAPSAEIVGEVTEEKGVTVEGAAEDLDAAAAKKTKTPEEPAKTNPE